MKYIAFKQQFSLKVTDLPIIYKAKALVGKIRWRYLDTVIVLVDFSHQYMFD